jgi:hypothetical protein
MDYVESLKKPANSKIFTVKDYEHFHNWAVSDILKEMRRFKDTNALPDYPYRRITRVGIETIIWQINMHAQHIGADSDVSLYSHKYGHAVTNIGQLIRSRFIKTPKTS